MTRLFYAALFNHYKAVNTLVESGANPNIINNQDQTAISVTNSATIVDTLVDFGGTESGFCQCPYGVAKNMICRGKNKQMGCESCNAGYTLVENHCLDCTEIQGETSFYENTLVDIYPEPCVELELCEYGVDYPGCGVNSWDNSWAMRSQLV